MPRSCRPHCSTAVPGGGGGACSRQGGTGLVFCGYLCVGRFLALETPEQLGGRRVVCAADAREQKQQQVRPPGPPRLGLPCSCRALLVSIAGGTFAVITCFMDPENDEEKIQVKTNKKTPIRSIIGAVIAAASTESQAAGTHRPECVCRGDGGRSGTRLLLRVPSAS